MMATQRSNASEHESIEQMDDGNTVKQRVRVSTMHQGQMDDGTQRSNAAAHASIEQMDDGNTARKQRIRASTMHQRQSRPDRRVFQHTSRKNICRQRETTYLRVQNAVRCFGQLGFRGERSRWGNDHQFQRNDSHPATVFRV